MVPVASLLGLLDRLLSKSVPGTLLVLAGGAIAGAGLLYGVWIGASELLVSQSGPTPASAGTPFASVGVVLLVGVALATLGGQLVGYSWDGR